jgi:hypothetical protein
VFPPVAILFGFKRQVDLALLGASGAGCLLFATPLGCDAWRSLVLHAV